MEIEAKFAVPDGYVFESNLLSAGVPCVQPRTYERNLRFDDAAGSLRAANKVLRLRQCGGQTILTYKADAGSENSIAHRVEIETEVSDLDNAMAILNGLGYEVSFIYEKFRSVFTDGELTLMVDRTPIGHFVEIEGPDDESIRDCAKRFGLDMADATSDSYSKLFRKWKERTGFSGRDMIF